MKKIITIALIIFVAVSLVYLVIRELGDESKTGAAGSGPAAVTPAVNKQKVIAYYFHTTKRCYSCRKIEELTSVAVQSNFADEIEEGRLELKVVNVDDPENRHFIKDYRLYTKSVVVSELKDGKEVRWKNLDQVWKLLSDEAAFINYVSSEVWSFLGEGR